MGRKSNFRVAPEDIEDDGFDERKLTRKQREQLAFKYGNRKTRRKIAKRNKFFKDKKNTVWRESNRMIREDDIDVSKL